MTGAFLQDKTVSPVIANINIFFIFLYILFNVLFFNYIYQSCLICSFRPWNWARAAPPNLVSHGGNQHPLLCVPFHARIIIDNRLWLSLKSKAAIYNFSGNEAIGDRAKRSQFLSAKVGSMQRATGGVTRIPVFCAGRRRYGNSGTRSTLRESLRRPGDLPHFRLPVRGQ